MNLAFSWQGLIGEVSDHQPTLDSLIHKDEDPIVASPQLPQLLSDTEKQPHNGTKSKSSLKVTDEARVIQKGEDLIVASPQLPQLISHTETQLSNGTDSNSSKKPTDEQSNIFFQDNCYTQGKNLENRGAEYYPHPKRERKAKHSSDKWECHYPGKTKIERKYCFCQETYNSKYAMVQCELCLEWYHNKCLGFKTLPSDKSLSTFYCGLNGCNKSVQYLKVMDEVWVNGPPLKKIKMLMWKM